MLAAAWMSRFRAALDLAKSRAAAATPATDLIACGFTSNVDLVVSLDDATLARLIAGRDVDLDGPRIVRAETPDQLVTAICQCLALGEGFDLPVPNAATQDWLMGLVSGRRQLGGTGSQVANTLAWLDFPTLVHLTGFSPEQVAVFDRPENVLVPVDGEFRSVSAAANPNDPTMWHVALEYVAGVSVQIGDRTITAPADSRVIVSYDPVNSTFQIDPVYVDAVERSARIVRRALISGYTQIVGDAELARMIDDSIAAARRWRAARPDMVIHSELGAMPRAADLAEVAETIAPEMTSIGVNADELRDLLGAWGIFQPERNGGIRVALDAVRNRISTPRINVHTAGYAVALTEGDPESERIALLFGGLVASTRARVGRYPTFADLEETIRCGCVHPSGLRLLEEMGLPDGIAANGSESFVVAPTISVPRPAATVGLGDSFTAGVLAML